MKRLLPLLILLAAPLANAQNVACVGHWFLPSTDVGFDVTCASHGIPVASIFVGNQTLAYETDADDAFNSLGVDDYTTRAYHSSNDEAQQGTTDSCSEHNNNAMKWSSQGSCIVRRTISAATTTDGITITPAGGSTELYGGFAVNFHANDCHAFSAGTGTTDTNTFAVTHTLGNTPNFGIFSYGEAHEGISGHGKTSIGFFDDNGGTHIQVAYTVTWRNAQPDGTANARLFSDRVGGTTEDSSGAEDESIELTANNATTTTFTAHNTLEGDLVGILCYEPDYQVFVGNIDSPDTAASDWDETTAGFLPEFVMMVMTNATVVDTTMTDDPEAGNISVFVTDFTTEVSAAAAAEGGASNTNTESRLDRDMYLADDDGTNDYLGTDMTAEATGIQITAANLTIADATTHLWPTLMLGPVAAGGDTYWWRRRH